MRRKLRALAIITVSVFAFFLILSTLLNRILSEERLKAMLIEPVQQELGRVVTLGSLKVSLLKGITITDIAIKERDSNQDFISVNTFRLSYELLPLLRKKLVIKEVLIVEPEIRIIRDSSGRFNFADIGHPPEEKREELIQVDDNNRVEPLPITMTFDRVNINNAFFSLTDQTAVLPQLSGKADLTMSVILGKTLPETRYNGTFNLLANGEYRGHKPVLQLTSSINEKLISYDGHLTIGFEKIKLQGWATNYLANPEIELNADINNLDLDELSSLKQFITDTSDQESPRPSQPPQQKNTRPTPIQAPADLNLSAHGRVNIGELSRGRIKIRKIALAYQLKDDIITLDDVQAMIFGGTLNGNISADIAKEQPAFQGKISAQEIKVGEIMNSLEKPAEILSGRLATELSFRGSGKEWPVIRQHLDGAGSFSLADGAIQSTPITTALATLLNIKELSDLHFQNLAGNFTITAGKVLLDSKLQNQNIDILANGTVGLDGSLDMPLTLQLSSAYGKRLAARTSISKYLADEQGGTTMHLRARGSIQKPQLSVDRNGLKKQAGRVVEQKIVEELGRAIIKNQSDTKVDSKEDPVKDASRMLLKRLLGD